MITGFVRECTKCVLVRVPVLWRKSRSPSQPLGPESRNTPRPNAWGRGALRDSGPSGCEGDYVNPSVISLCCCKLLNLITMVVKKPRPYVNWDKGGKFLKKLWCCVGGSITR